MAQPRREPGHGPDTGTPGWVKAFGAIALVLVVLFILLHVTGHAPMGHGG